MEGIYNFLFPFLKGNFIGQRIVAATVLAEFINHCQVKKTKHWLLQSFKNLFISLE